MTTLQDTFNNADNLNELLGSEVVGGELRPLDHDDSTTLTFNGTNQDATAFGYFGVTGTSARTFMCWIRNTDSSANGTIIHFGLAGTNGARYLIQLESGVPTLRAISNVIAWGNNISDGQWHHLALTNPASATTSQFSCYVDGIKVTPSTVTGSDTINISADGYVSLMARTGEPLGSTVNLYLPGSMDDTRLYSRELTEDEIFSFIHAGIEPSTTNLEAHWLFNEGSGTSVNDQSPNNRDLTLTGSPTWITTHKPFYATRSRSTSTELVTSAGSITDFDFTVAKKSAGTLGRFQFSDDGSSWVNAAGNSLAYGAYEFDGINDTITVADSDEFSFGNGSTDSAFSVSAWIYMHDATNFKIVGKDDNSSSREWLFHTTVGDALLLQILDESTGNRQEAGLLSVTHLENQWVHVAATYDGRGGATADDGIEVYVNGNNVTNYRFTAGSYTAMENTGQGVQIGARGVSQYANGFISDVRIYGEELTANDVSDLYLNAIDPDDTNLIAHYKFNGNANDETGNHNGSVSGALNTTDWKHLPAIGSNSNTVETVVSFDGVNDNMQVTDNNVFSFGNGSTDSPFSISAWVYADDMSNIYILSKIGQSFVNSAEYEFGIGGADVFFLQIFDDSSSNYIGRGSDVISHLAGSWHHYACTYDGSSSVGGIKLYIDGNRVDTTNRTGGSYTAMQNHGEQPRIGWRFPSTYSECKIANLALWGDERTQAEIIAEVENGWVDYQDANCIAYWPMNDSTSTQTELVAGRSAFGSGYARVTDYKRPAPTEPTQQNIDISGLGFTDFNYRWVTDSSRAELTTAITEVTVTYLTEQNIVIKDSEGTTIADGETTPQDFGTTLQNATAPTLTFTIENTGESTLTISSIDLPSGYSISGATPSSVAGESTETFTVQLSTATAGTFTGDVVVNSNDPDIAAYNFAITGTITAIQNIVIKDSEGTTIADGETTPQTFTTTDQNDPSPSLTFTIENTGENTLTISSIDLPSGYSISGSTPSSVAGESETTFTVILSTSTVGTFTGDVVVNSDDPDIAAYNFAITGTIESGVLVSLTGAIVNRFDNDLATLQGMISDMFAGQVSTDTALPYVSVTELDSTRQIQAKGSPGYKINRDEVMFEVFGTTKNEVHLILRQIESDYLNTSLDVRYRTQLGRPIKINRTSFKDGDLWVGQLSLMYPLEKAGA